MKKIIMALTNVDHYGDNTELKTGVWLEEAASFYDVMSKAGLQVVFASVKGGAVPLDPRSVQNASAETNRIASDQLFKDGMANTVTLASLNPDDFAAIYFCGGHGAMYDFPDSEDLQKLSLAIYNNGGYITSVCHGEAGLTGLKDADGQALVKGKKVNGFTNTEERMSGGADIMPFSPEDELKALGAEFLQGAPFTEFVVADQRFITGQNPMSSVRVATLLTEALGRVD